MQKNKVKVAGMETPTKTSRFTYQHNTLRYGHKFDNMYRQNIGTSFWR